jgi:hypothetical protein
MGICYTEIQEWNRGIMSFIKALNEYKTRKNTVKYAECMNNLGNLYLNAEEISLAENCFLLSYDIKRK